MGVVAGITFSGIGSAAMLLIAVILWVLGHRDDDVSPQLDDPHAPDEHGFIPADKYGYGYDYSWGDPYGDPDL